MPPVATLHVDRLVRGHRVQPRPNRAAGVEPIALQVDLEERLLEDVLGRLLVAEVVAKVTEQLALVALDQLAEGATVAVGTVAQQ